MKYILSIIGATVLVALFMPLYVLFALWKFKFHHVRELWTDYKSIVVNNLWRGFKINKYNWL